MKGLASEQNNSRRKVRLLQREAIRPIGLGLMLATRGRQIQQQTKYSHFEKWNHSQYRERIGIDPEDLSGSFISG